MQPGLIRVLLVEDDEDDVVLTKDSLSEVRLGNFQIEWVATFDAALEALGHGSTDVCLLDYRLGEHTGLDLLREANARGFRVPIILLTGQGSEDIDHAAMEAGAADYLTKSEIDPALLERSIRYALQHKRVEEEIRDLNLRLEERVRQRTAELNAVNEELEAFSFSVSHDLRNPLRAIDGFAKILEEDYGSTLDEQGQQHLGRIRGAAARMRELIHDLIELAHVTRVDIERQVVDLTAMAESIAGDLRQISPERRVAFMIAPGLTADGDARLLRLAIQNLIDNAWKYSRGRPEARIEVGVQVLERDGGTSPVFFVRDNGVGFDMAHAEKLFKPFQRLHGPDEFEGTGIGLATVQRIIRRHGGRVWAEASVDKGATIYFTL